MGSTAATTASRPATAPSCAATAITKPASSVAASGIAFNLMAPGLAADFAASSDGDQHPLVTFARNEVLANVTSRCAIWLPEEHSGFLENSCGTPDGIQIALSTMEGSGPVECVKENGETFPCGPRSCNE